jgi:hypothetical protein
MGAITLAEGLSQLNLDLPAATQEKLLAYLALLHKWNKVYNLTAVRGEAQMLTHVRRKRSSMSAAVPGYRAFRWRWLCPKSKSRCWTAIIKRPLFCGR